MKTFLPFLVMVVIGCVSGFPHRNYATFTPCRTANDLQTLWPDWDNNRIFHQCMAVGVWGTHDCPADLLFSFDFQVCVWEYMWEPPPSQDSITPFPTTQWPPRDSTITQEITVPTDDGTDTTMPTIPTLPTIPVPTTEPPPTDPNTPSLTPPTPEATTVPGPTPPTPGPTIPGEVPSFPDDPILTPPTPSPTNGPDATVPNTPPTPQPTDDPNVPRFTPEE